MSSDLNKMFSLKDFGLVACTKAYSNWSLNPNQNDYISGTNCPNKAVFLSVVQWLYKNIDQIGPWREPWRAFFWQRSPRISLLGSTSRSIWLMFTRTVTPLEKFMWFPQIVFALLTSVRPINVGFSNHFFCWSYKRCLMLIIKKNVEEEKS